MKFNEFDKAMRRFEASLDQFCPDGTYLVLRLDGRGFTRLTKSVLEFERPFDFRFHKAMQGVCEHLMSCAGTTLFCYTQSDEISILLDPAEIAFNGKTRKINSVMAGEASAAFTAKIGQMACFDCRVCPLPNVGDVSDYFRWRAEDAKRNALSAYCYWGLRNEGSTPSQADRRLHGMTGPEKRAFLEDEIGIDTATLPEWQTHGAYAEWQDIPHVGVNPITNEEVPTTRRRIQWLDPAPQGEAMAAKVVSLLEVAA